MTFLMVNPNSLKLSENYILKSYHYKNIKWNLTVNILLKKKVSKQNQQEKRR